MADLANLYKCMIIVDTHTKEHTYRINFQIEGEWYVFLSHMSVVVFTIIFVSANNSKQDLKFHAT